MGSILTIASCKTSSDAEFEVIQSEIIHITAPDKVNSNQQVAVEVSFYGRNGCSEPYNIKATQVGQTIRLTAFYKQPIAPMISCTEILPLHTLTYMFFADLPGAHFFQSANNNAIADTLIVF